MVELNDSIKFSIQHFNSNKYSFNVKIGVPPRARWQLVLNMYARPKSPRTAKNESIPMKMKNPGVDVIPDMLISNKQFVQLMHIMLVM